MSSRKTSQTATISQCPRPDLNRDLKDFKSTNAPKIQPESPTETAAAEPAHATGAAELTPGDDGTALAHARNTSQFSTGRLDDRLVAHIQNIRDAIRETDKTKLLTSEMLGGALRTLDHACEIFIGWHERIDDPIAIDISPNGFCGDFSVTSKEASGDRETFRCDGSRWRSSYGPVTSTVDVALSLGKPISYLDGLVDGIAACAEKQRGPSRSPRDKQSLFSNIEDAATLIGVPADLVEQWVSAQLIPFQRFPGNDQPWFKTTEVKRWAADFGQKHGGLENSPNIEVVGPAAEPTTFHLVPEAIRNISGLRRVSMENSISGIYFLCRQGQVVYVGQSVSVLSRVSSHQGEGCKKFDAAFFFPCAPRHLDKCERDLINTLMPEYNADSATRALRRCSDSALAPRPPKPTSGGIR